MRESGARIACRWGWGGDFCSGELVEVVDIANGWAQLSDGNYVSAQYLMAVTTSDDGAATTMYVTCRTLNVRAGAGTNFEILGTLSRGTEVEILDVLPGWYEIEYLGGEAYVSAAYIG